ncbi:MAG: hypothetical protein K6G03_01245, partial [Lachnospiraceae bacterium]|nr:hypothetical protein [Lachnospiraceae bacterium]
MLKKGIKVFAGIVIFFVMSLLILALVIKYEISWRITDIETKTSPDGRYSILFQSIGEADFPFGSSHAKVTVKDGDKVIESFKEDIADDGGAFRPDNYKVEWMPVGVVITFRGSEQADHEVLIFYDGRESFEGYTDKEIEEILKSRYKFDEIERIIPKADGYEVRANGIDFYADKTLSFHDSYLQEYVKTMTDYVFPELVQRSISWEKQTGDSPAEIVYTPVISMDGLGNQDLEAFSEDICRWLEYCFDRLPYEEGKTAYTGFIPEIPGYQNTKYYFS